MPIAHLIEALRTTLCPSLTVREAEHIANATVPRRVAADHDICHEGDRTAGLIFLVKGTADILKETPHGAAQGLATVEGPIMLGEIGPLTGDPISATIRARSEGEGFTLTRSQYQRLLEHEGLAISKLVTAIPPVLAPRLSAPSSRTVALPQARSG